MSKKPKNNLPQYNGTKVFQKVAQRVKEERLKREGRDKLRWGEWNEIQKLVKQRKLAEPFYGTSYKKVDVALVDSYIENKVLEPTQIDCGNPFALNIVDYTGVEWYDIDNVVKELPDNLNINVNFGSLGQLGIKKRAFYDYSDIRGMFEELREIANNQSGEFFFDATIRKIDPNKPDDDLCNLFVEFALTQGGQAVPSQGSDADFVVPLSDEEVKQAKKRAELIKKLKKKRKPKKAPKTEPKPEPKPKPRTDSDKTARLKAFDSIQKNALKSFELGLISKAEYRKLIKDAQRNLEKGGQI